MMNYKLVNYTAEMKAPGKLFCDVLETTTNQLIKKNIPGPEAKELCRHLNLGGAFDGFTPAFFLAEIDPKPLESNELEDDFF